MSLIKFPWTNLHEINLDWIVEEIKKCYSPDNPPTNVVLSVNGQTGEVILYPDATVNFPEVSETSWTIGRTTNGTPVGIKFNKTLPMQRVNGNSLFNVYDQGNPPPYPVTSVNGQTGNVVIQVAFTDLSMSSISFITASPDHSWSLDRETVDGAISIKLDTTNNTPSAYLEYVSADETVTETVKLLTLDDIPSSSGVISINGASGVVVLHADDISRTSSNNETVEHCLSSLTTDTQNISSKIGNTAMGTTATTVTGAIKEHSDKIGNTTMGTTANTLTGAIAEHEGDISTINTTLTSKGNVSYIDINITNDNGIQINSASGNVINWANFINAYVIGTNGITVIAYTYSNLMYIRLKNYSTMADVTAGDYTVRCWYKSN